MGRVSDLLEAARRAASLDDFGEDSFREGLERLIASADAQARFTTSGAQAFDRMVVNFLTCRLQVEHWYALHPEIGEQEIVAPLIGLGLPRTGSTAFSCLLAEDPKVRFIRTWESMRPCPPPDKATEDADPRIAEAAAAQKIMEQRFPRMKSMLPISPTAPIECQNFMGYDFKSQTFQAIADVSGYIQWLLHDADLVPTYRYVKRVLKLLQWRCPPNKWRLKNPSHTPFIAALDEVFPDARYWMTHRAIDKVIPSVVDLHIEMSSPFSDSIDVAAIVRENEYWWETGMRRMIAFRDTGNDHRFFDIHFAEFQADPIAAIERLYAFLGETLSEEARTRMEDWRRNTPRETSGGGYDAAALGIDAERLRQRFAFYAARFAA